MWNFLIILTLFRIVHCGIVSNSAVSHSSSIGGQGSNYISVSNSKGPNSYSGEGNYISVSSSSDPFGTSSGGSNYVSTSSGSGLQGTNYISYSGTGATTSAGSNSIALSNLQDPTPATGPNYVSLDLSNHQGQISGTSASTFSSSSSSDSSVLTTSENSDDTASLTINSAAPAKKWPCPQKAEVEQELGTENTAEANSGSSATATLEVNPIVVRQGCGVEFSSPPIRVDRPAIRFGYDEVPPPGPYHTPNCGCTPKGSCHGEVGLFTRQVVHMSDLICGLRFEACCYDGPWPGVADEFVRAAQCIPEEECIRPYGILPTDVRDYGVIAPCPGHGAVRCLIVDAQGLLEFKAALAEIQISTRPQPEAEVHVDSDSAQVTPVHIDIPITKTAAEVSATTFTAVESVTPEEPSVPEPLPAPVEVKIQPPAPAVPEPCEEVRVVAPTSSANANSNSVASTISTVNIPQVFYPAPTVVQFPAAVGSVHDYVHNFDGRKRTFIHPTSTRILVPDSNSNANAEATSSVSTFSSSGSDANPVADAKENSQASVSTFTSTLTGTESNSNAAAAAPVSTSTTTVLHAADGSAGLALSSPAFHPVRQGGFVGYYGGPYGFGFRKRLNLYKGYDHGLGGYGYSYGLGK